MFRRFLLSAAAFVALVTQADAGLTISGQPTHSVTCSAGVCTATAKRATLNADDLVVMLQSGDVTIQPGARAKDIELKSIVSWATSSRLILDSYRGITIGREIEVDGPSGAGVTLTTNDGGSGGSLLFAPHGKIDFALTSDSLVINGASYQIASGISGIALAFFEDSSGHVALGGDIDNFGGGSDEDSPIQEPFTGTFTGLGHTISHLKIDATGFPGKAIGLFDTTSGTISDLHLTGIHVRAGAEGPVGGLEGVCAGPIVNVDVSGRVSGGKGSQVGGLCGASDAPITGSFTSGNVNGSGRDKNSYVGGLVGDHQGGAILNCHSTATVKGARGWIAGGLVGHSQDAVSASYATGKVTVDVNGFAGGLIGSNTGAVQNSYATGFATGGVASTVGGLIGLNNASVSESYSSGAVASGSGNAVGGFIGTDNGSADLTDTYFDFDIDTSGQSHGVGNNTGYPGITGLSTAQFQAGLPTGFDPAVWAENSGINGGLPYLIANPPQ
jgi:hypothetical protein